MDLQLDRKIALVTGSSRGTGSVIAQTLAAEGAQVIIHGLEEGSGQQVAQTIRDAGGKAEDVFGDIRTQEGATTLIEQLEAEARSIDILINNYGAAARGSWSDTSDQTWASAFETNLMSAVRMMRHFSGAMRKKGWGRIIQLGTIGSTRPGSRMPGYYAAKAALAASSVSLSKELDGTGITVNTVSPGLIKTPEVESYYIAHGQKQGWGDTWEQVEPHVVARDMPNPVGRIATREEIADLVVFLCSPRAGYINGQNLRIDGGALDIVT